MVSSGRDTRAVLVTGRGHCGVSQTSIARVPRAPIPGAGVRRGTQYLELELGCGHRSGLGV